MFSLEPVTQKSSSNQWLQLQCNVLSVDQFEQEKQYSSVKFDALPRGSSRPGKLFLHLEYCVHPYHEITLLVKPF